MRVEFLDLAQKELDDAFNYYEYQQKNLGYRFIYEVEESLKLIKQYPKAWSKISKKCKKMLA